MWKYHHEGLFCFFCVCVTYVEPKYQSYEHNHKFFPMFDLDILSMSSYLLCGTTLIVLSISI